MEFIFIRHGQGEHTLKVPDSLHTHDPSLTQTGMNQVEALQSQLSITERDLVVISPVRRTLETAHILTKGVDCRTIVSPLVSPRMFPQKPEWKTLPCDKMLHKKVVKVDFPDFSIDDVLSEDLWATGINTMTEEEFRIIAESFLSWCKSQRDERIYIVSHDGTINSYREIMVGEKLRREDFLTDAGWMKLSY
ncbi:histidine phosphatase family protein [Rossellomorea aquimaris]|uniref:histidine phosphatase family protein n=1 Tax=Rossellomorea aquimaris TaxID=189382 RepID=UPI001CFEB745|nr:histidine phosphatase family protein [Rossellomorea aquimaris]